MTNGLPKIPDIKVMTRIKLMNNAVRALIISVILGRLYWGIGDVGFNGTGPDGKEWKYPNQGVIVRSELDGSNFEVFARGLRNTHEFVFDKYANLISEDNDGDHAGESERLVYIVEESDTGWRINWQFGKLSLIHI